MAFSNMQSLMPIRFNIDNIYQPQGQIRCIGSIPEALTQMRSAYSDEVYDSVRQLCAKSIYGGKYGVWTAGAYCAYFAAPKSIFFDPVHGSIDEYLDLTTAFFCKMRCRCVEGSPEGLDDQGKPAYQIQVAENAAQSTDMNERRRSFDFNPIWMLVGTAKATPSTPGLEWDRLPAYVTFVRQHHSIFPEWLRDGVNVTTKMIPPPRDVKEIYCQSNLRERRPYTYLPSYLHQLYILDDNPDYDDRYDNDPAALCAAKFWRGSWAGSMGMVCKNDAQEPTQDPILAHPAFSADENFPDYQEIKSYCLRVCHCGDNEPPPEGIAEASVTMLDFGAGIDSSPLTFDAWTNEAEQEGRFPVQEGNYADKENVAAKRARYQRIQSLRQESVCSPRTSCTDWRGCSLARQKPGCTQAVCGAIRQGQNWVGRCVDRRDVSERTRLGGRSMRRDLGSRYTGTDSTFGSASGDGLCLCNSTFVDQACCTAKDGLVWK